MKFRFFTTAVSAVLFALGGCNTAVPVGSKNVWQATKTSDPVKGISRCVVTAPDRTAGLAFSRSFALYPVVERHPEFGLLVGVSSGGLYKVPVGNIVWRVDDNRYRTLKAVDTPTGEPKVHGINMAGILATSTLASGAKARAMLNEMRKGESLIFRVDVPNDSLGLPTQRTAQVGILSNGKLQPIPLDASFQRALSTCGI